MTVTRIAFSPDDRYLLSVSRDRSWRLFESQDGGGRFAWGTSTTNMVNSLKTGYAAVAADKSHSRIIWDCAWSREGDCFATASRDKTVRKLTHFIGRSQITFTQVKIWKCAQGSKWEAIATIKTDSGATAVDFTARDTHGGYVLCPCVV